MDNNELNIGDRVRWQNRGKDQEREGTIVAIIPAEENAIELLNRVLGPHWEKRYRREFTHTHSFNQTRYIVAAPSGPLGGKPPLFRPYPQKLKKI